MSRGGVIRARIALPVPKVWRYASERERSSVHDVDGGGGDEKVKHSEGTTYRRDEVAIQGKAWLLEQVHNELGARRRFRTPL